MAKVKFRRLMTNGEVEKEPIVDGQFIVTKEGTGYIDYGSDRVSFNSNPLSYYPVGSIYMNVTNVNPKDLFGGKWEQLQNRFLLGAGELQAGAIGGEKEHKLTVDEMPAHNHDAIYMSSNQGGNTYARLISGNINDNTSNLTNNSIKFTGGSKPHNNMPPYLVVYMWKRVA